MQGPHEGREPLCVDHGSRERLLHGSRPFGGASTRSQRAARVGVIRRGSPRTGEVGPRPAARQSRSERRRCLGCPLRWPHGHEPRWQRRFPRPLPRRLEPPRRGVRQARFSPHTNRPAPSSTSSDRREASQARRTTCRRTSSRSQLSCGAASEPGRTKRAQAEMRFGKLSQGTPASSRKRTIRSGSTSSGAGPTARRRCPARPRM